MNACKRHDVGEISRRTTDKEADYTCTAVPVCLCVPDKTSCSTPGCPRKLKPDADQWWHEFAVARHDCCGTYEYDVPDLLAEQHKRSMEAAVAAIEDVADGGHSIEAVQSMRILSSLPKPK